MPIASAITGSVQTSKAVTALRDATDNASRRIDAGSTGAQTGMTNTTNDANNVLDYINSQQQNTLNPYLQLGELGAKNLTTALGPGGSLQEQFSFDPTKIADNPNYKFQMQQGLEAVQKAAAANGTLMSGGTLKALDQFSQGLASNEIGQSYNQAFNTFSANRANAYQSLALPLQVGQQAVPLSLQANQNFGDRSSTNLINAQTFNSKAQIDQAQKQADLDLQKGNAKAGGSLAQANIWSNFANEVGGSNSLKSLGQAAVGI